MSVYEFKHDQMTVHKTKRMQIFYGAFKEKVFPLHFIRAFKESYLHCTSTNRPTLINIIRKAGYPRLKKPSNIRRPDIQCTTAKLYIPHWYGSPISVVSRCPATTGNLTLLHPFSCPTSLTGALTF